VYKEYLKILLIFAGLFFVAQELFHKPILLALMVFILLLAGYVALAKVLPNPNAGVTFFYLSVITLLIYFELPPLTAVAVSVFVGAVAKIALDAKDLKYISKPEINQ
jgi:hypothetical protein